MSEEGNLRVGQNLFECFARGHAPGIVRLLDDDPDWHIKEQ